MCDKITLTIPPKTDYVMPLRLMSASLSTRAGLNIDEVEDVKIALTEAMALCIKASSSHLIDALIEISSQCIKICLVVKKDDENNDELEIETELCKHLIEATTSYYEIKDEDSKLHIVFKKEKEEQ